MPRIGQNPMKWQSSVHQPEKITATTIVHIPFLDGYWKHSLDVLKLCLKSVRENTNEAFDLMVFDNGSCREVKDYLSGMNQKGEIQFLILSEKNIGKVGAWNVLFSAAPGEIVAYSDSDIYFLTNWLEELLIILENFPKVGMVSAQPIPGNLTKHAEATISGAKAYPEITVSEGNDLIPEHFVESNRRGLGDTKEEFQKRIFPRRDVLLEKNKVSAFVSAAHHQFLSRKQILESLLPLATGTPMIKGGKNEFDERMENQGFWRLSTINYLIHHMGNTVPDFQSELPWAKLNFPKTQIQKPTHSFFISKKISQNSRVRTILKKINSLTYRILHK